MRDSHIALIQLKQISDHTITDILHFSKKSSKYSDSLTGSD